MSWGGGGDHLNSAVPQGGSEKFHSYSRGITKNLQNLKNFQRPPLPIKNDTSLKATSHSMIFDIPMRPVHEDHDVLPVKDDPQFP